jgi:hypothetical protein
MWTKENLWHGSKLNLCHTRMQRTMSESEVGILENIRTFDRYRSVDDVSRQLSYGQMLGTA